MTKKSDSSIGSRREFLAGAGALTGLCVLSRLNPAGASEDWDLIVVGAGTAGLPTALFAAERGARVLVVEKSHRLGGTLDRSGARMVAAGSKVQKAKGIHDTPDLHYADIMRISRGTVNHDLARLCVDNAADTIDWLVEHGFEVLPEHPVVTGSGHEPESIPRYLWGKHAGFSVLDVLLPELEKHVRTGTLRFAMRTDAVELIQESSGVVGGIVGEDEDGRKTEYSSRYVALTSGGCNANPQMYEEIHGIPLYGRRAYPFNHGGGITLGLSAGGYIWGREKYLSSFGQVLLDFNFPSPSLTFATTQPERRQPWEVFVNVNGQRFVREDHPSVDHREHSLTDQPGHRFWAIFDQEIYDTAPPFLSRWSREQTDEAFRRYHYFTKANTLSELARRAGIDAAALLSTIDRYNRSQAAGRDPDFARQHMPLPVTKPPFYGVRLQGTTLLSWAGLAVDNKLRVIREDGRPIPNLYAAGEIIGAGATCGNSVVNGMMVTPAITFGRLIGRQLLTFA